jgi:hypothetical protein
MLAFSFKFFISHRYYFFFLSESNIFYKSAMSETNTPASTPTSVTATEDEAMLVKEIRKYNTEALIEFLQNGENLHLDEEDFEIIRNQKINGRNFLEIKEERLMRFGMKFGPAVTLVKFAKECKKKRLRTFSSYHSLREVLKKYDINSDSMVSIPQFIPGMLS